MRRRRAGEPGALEVLEEAFALLRRTPATTLARFYVGSIPFVLALLFFWAEMSHGAFARERAAVGALALAMLYLWMKCWQAVFARGLLEQLAGPGTGPGDPPLALLRVQGGHQPFSLPLLPLAALILLPYAWVYAYFQALSLTNDPAAARRQAALWPRQNHFLISVLFLFGVFVFLNVATGLALLPWLVRMLLGIQTVATRSPASLFSSTFWAASLGLTYLAMGPLVKAAYVVRGFRGEALATGQDLLAAFRAAGRRIATLLLLGLVLAGAATAPAALAATAPGPEPPRGATAAGEGPLGVGVSAAAATAPATSAAPRAAAPAPQQPTAPPEPAGPAGDSSTLAADGSGGQDAAPLARRAERLERSIEAVLQRNEFSWRLRRVKAPPVEETSWLAGWLAKLAEPFRDVAKKVEEWIDKFFNWLEDWLNRRQPRPDDSGGMDWLGSVYGLYLVLFLAVAATGALLLWRSRRRAPALVEAVEVAAAEPDLHADDSTAAQAPADHWLAKAEQFAARGELRLAVRALYLAGLSRLAERELVTLARFKSNRDYGRELDRRARRWPEVAPLFADNVLRFERVWYGRHAADREAVDRLTANLQQLAPTGTDA